jgi:hypothetical protein
VVDPDAPEDDDVAPTAAKKSDAFCLFTTGLGFSSEKKTRLRTVVESAAEKKKFSRTWCPNLSMHGLVHRCWARKPSCDFAADLINSNYVVARELGLGSPFDPCNLRCWILTRRAGSKGDFRIGHKRFHECLKHANFPPEHSALNLKAIIQSVHNRLETSCLSSDPTDPTPPPIAAAHHNESKKVVTLSAAKKRKSLKASPQFELIHAHDSGPFEQRLTQNTECLQIALFFIDFIFSSIDDEPVDTVDARTELYFSMFNACCSSRRFVELCQGLLALFDSPVPERDKVHKLLTVLWKDSNINLLDCASGKSLVGFRPNCFPARQNLP